ncbi:FAD dependent oxidoreductase [Bradyrhizobium oligotrophicum S58]|uniref:FAD dependent oxidoreductase n=1 Tax=Bradyrhizobium oligotrophicum S58 TaxID=1245469 RepID=M4ZAJ3_9BRAD|nr:FAD-binding oxidoreductase [Bradyrhizobium oligotrophicum]BAM90376.1 FAD dependent oxidoreductase [Bradyrhizobium oligotrophicum S58]
MHAEVTEGLEAFEELVRSSPVDVEPQRGGHLYIAHRQRNLDKIAAESKVLNDVFGYASHVISHEELANDFVNEAEAVGAVHRLEQACIRPSSPSAICRWRARSARGSIPQARSSASSNATGSSCCARPVALSV